MSKEPADKKETPPALKKLTADQKTKLAAWVSSHTKATDGCPICRHPTWQASEEFVEIRPHYEKVFFGGHVYPQVLLMCENCGYTMLFNALKAGILEPPKSEPPTNAG